MSTDREAGAKPERKKSRQDQHEQRGKKREEKCVSTSNLCLVMLYHLTPLFGQTSLKCLLHCSLGQTIIRQTILFGYAILCDETTDSFKWHFITYLTAMSRKRHVTIFYGSLCNNGQSKTTLSSQAQSTFFCLWHIYQNAAMLGFLLI
jgi:hypothetical protein